MPRNSGRHRAFRDYRSTGGQKMADDKTNRGAQDRARVAAGEQYEVAYFAGKHGLTMEDARRIIQEAGPSRDKADEMASRSK
jgi:hypothetical protein